MPSERLRPSVEPEGGAGSAPAPSTASAIGQRDSPSLGAGGGKGRAVTRAVARWAGVAPSQVAIVSGATARRKLVEIQREDAFPPPDV